MRATPASQIVERKGRAGSMERAARDQRGWILVGYATVAMVVAGACKSGEGDWALVGWAVVMVGFCWIALETKGAVALVVRTQKAPVALTKRKSAAKAARY